MEKLKEELIQCLIRKLKNDNPITDTELSLLKLLIITR